MTFSYRWKMLKMLKWSPKAPVLRLTQVSFCVRSSPHVTSSKEFTGWLGQLGLVLHPQYVCCIFLSVIVPFMGPLYLFLRELKYTLKVLQLERGNWSVLGHPAAHPYPHYLLPAFSNQVSNELIWIFSWWKLFWIGLRDQFVFVHCSQQSPEAYFRWSSVRKVFVREDSSVE